MSNYVCGFCMTGHHHNCKKQITYYDKTWVCQCNCNKPKPENEKKEN